MSDRDIFTIPIPRKPDSYEVIEPDGEIGVLSGMPPDDDFISLVDERSANSDGTVIYNSDFTHAAYLIDTMIRQAAESGKALRIVTGSARTNFYQFMIAPMREALTKLKDKVELVVLDHKADVENSDFIYEILLGGGHVFWATKQLKEDYDHFTVVGDSIYRREYNHPECWAKASFSDKKEGGRLLETFNRILSDPALGKLRLSA